MSEEKYKQMNSDDEDDLESLRIAALKSINAKRDSPPNKSQTKLLSSGNNIVHLQGDNQPALSNKEAIYLMAHQHQNPLVLQSYGMNSETDGTRSIGHPTYFPQAKPYHQSPVNHMNIYPHVSSYIPASHPRPLVHPGATIINNLPRQPAPVRHWLPQGQTPNGSDIYSANKGVVPYTPKPINKDTHTADVQLSPRSLAFVAQNNGILARRKIEADLSPKKHYRRSKSPNYRRISRSPSPEYRQSPGRWSVSPPLHSLRQRFSKSKSKSPPRRSRSKPCQYNYKRSRSRSSSESRHIIERKRRSFSRNSDYRPSSPNLYNRHSSRSPPISKTVNVVRRNKSRSPLQRRYSPVHTVPHRRLSRSRSPRRNYFEHRKSRSPQGIRKRMSPNLNKRNQRRPLDRKSPIRNKRKSPIREINRRDSPLQNSSLNRRLGRKSTSPQLRKRSRTPRSPGNVTNKKFIRKSRDRQIATATSNSQIQHNNTNTRKRSPIVNTFKNKNNESYNSYNSNNNNNNHIRTDARNKTDFELRKSKSPVIRKQRSRSKTSEKMVRKEESKKENELLQNRVCDKKTNQKILESQNNQVLCTSLKLKDTLEKYSPKSSNEAIKNKNEESKTPPPTEDNFESLTPPIDKDMDDAKLIEEIDAMLADSKSNLSNSSDEEDDGIDLFASEESESENEGRFKLSNKTERSANVQAMSFTKLKESSTTSHVRNLQDVVSDEKFTENQNKNKKDYFKKYSRNTRNDNRKLGDDYSGSKRRSRSNSFDKNKSGDINENSNKSKFKSTFQIIKNEGLRILSKPSLKNNNRSTPERNVKKRSKDHSSSEQNQLNLELKDRKTTIESMNTPPHLLEQLRSNKSQSYGKSGYDNEQKRNDKVIGTSKSSKSSISSRKPIHSRLGAMTNTFKAPNKTSWSTNSSYNDQV